jgi:uncharacterized membrane protein
VLKEFQNGKRLLEYRTLGNGDAMLSNLSPAGRGAVLLVTGISIFGFSDNLTLLVSDQVGVGQFHFSRSLFAIGMVALLGRLWGLSVVPQYWKPVLARTAFMVTSMLLYFGVMPMMPIAEAGAGLFTSPIFVLLFSIIFFKERIGWRRIFAVMIGSGGVLLVLRPGSAGFTIYHMLPCAGWSILCHGVHHHLPPSSRGESSGDPDEFYCQHRDSWRICHNGPDTLSRVCWTTGTGTIPVLRLAGR